MQKVLTRLEKSGQFLVMLKKSTPTKSKDVPFELGEALRLRRKEMGLTMQAVADQAGLSVGFISQVERGLATPSLGSLASLAAVLETHLSAFLDQPAAEGQTTRQDKRQSYRVPGAEMVYERISTTFPGSKIHSVITHEPPGYRGEPISHSGEEMFYIIDGAITVEIEGEVEVLRKGDSIHFDSRRTHSSWNHTDKTASILWCGTMDVFGDAPEPIHKPSSQQKPNNDQTGEGKP